VHPDTGPLRTPDQHAHPDGGACGHHVLVAGLADDTATVRSLLGALPACTVGQVLLEAEPDRAPDVAGWDVPGRVAVHVLRRDTTPVARRRRGRRLATALDAWVTEWLDPEGCACAGPFTLWVGGAGNAEVEVLCRRLERGLDPASAHLHRPGR